jgi:hypothetical protein
MARPNEPLPWAVLAGIVFMIVCILGLFLVALIAHK